MKKIISLLISIIMVFPAAWILAAEDTSSTKDSYDNAFYCRDRMLVTLGVFEREHSKNMFSEKVTRLEFCGYLAALLGIKEQRLTVSTYFNDVSEMYINNLVGMKIIKGCGDGNFEPDRIVSSGEAITMILRALGYGKFIESRGGLLEYSRKVIKSGIGFNKDLSAELTLKDTIDLFFDILDKPVLVIKAVTETNGSISVTYTDKEDISFLEAYRNSYLIRGQMTANFITSIGDTEPVERDQVVIGNTIYECNDLEAFSLIGQRVIAVYNNTSKNIDYIAPDYEKMEVFELTAEEIQSYNDFKLTYFSSNNKKKSISFDKKLLKVIYNGKAIDSDFKDAFEMALGTVKLYSANRSSSYTVAVIEEYVDITVKMASTETLKVYTDGIGDMSTLNFEDADRPGIYKSILSSASGLPIGLKSVSEGDLLSVCRSRDNSYIVAYVCSEIVTGEVTSTKTDNDTLYAEIDGEEYPVSPYYKGIMLKPGHTGKFFLNKFGYIGQAWEIEYAKAEIGYLYGAATENDTPLSSEVNVKIYTDTKEHIIYSLSDKVKFDGARISKSDAYKKLAPDNIVSKGLIKYTVNSKGRISVIETGTGDTNFAEMTKGAQKLKYVEQNRAFGQNGEYVMTLGTKVFMVPRGDENHIPENFNIVNYRESMTPAFTTEETVRIYQDNNDPFAEYVVCFYDNRKTTIYGSGSIHMMVDKVITKVSDDGDTINVLKGYSNCMPFEIAITDDVQVLAYAGVELKGIDVIERGDWIVGTTNATGSISYLLLMYNADKDVFNPSKPGVHAFHDSQGKLTNANYHDGDILKVERGGTDGSEVLLVLGDKETGEIRNCIVLDEDLMKFMIYDASKRNDEFSVGNIDDIISLEMTNGSYCDRAYFEFRSNSRFTNMAIYRH